MYMSKKSYQNFVNYKSRTIETHFQKKFKIGMHYTTICYLQRNYQLLLKIYLLKTKTKAFKAAGKTIKENNRINTLMRRYNV